MKKEKIVGIIGAGPAGLTAGYLLAKQGIPVIIFEADPEYVGGISRTVRHQGFHFDIGGHRFFSKSERVEEFWTEILPDDMLIRPRSSKIYYRRRFFTYPLKAFEALFKLGIFETIRCVLSYVKATLSPTPNPRSLEDWVSNQFGKRLFNIFFKTYNEKVWGMSCKEISADWAAQRIKGLSLGSAIKNALLPSFKPKNRGEVIKTLIESFRYPRKGPGMMWEACATKIQAMGGRIVMGHAVSGLYYDAATERWKVEAKSRDGSGKIVETVTEVISSAPINELSRAIQPAFSAQALKAAQSLRYRDFLTVALMVEGKDLFPDNWIYIHDPGVKVGRIQNFKSWSPEMLPSEGVGCYGLEYFCFEGDGLWNSTDSELVELAKKELRSLGLAESMKILDGAVVRQKKAYPVYDDHYTAHVAAVRQEIESRFPGLHLVGRNGMHKYNNQDHAMMTAMLTVENIVAGEKVYDTWQVNQDAEYHEEGKSSSTSGLRAVPTRLKPEEQAKDADAERKKAS